MFRRLLRRDANQAKLVRLLHAVGALVIDLSAVGSGVPDLLVLFRGSMYLIEIKNLDGRARSKTNRFTPAQLTLYRQIRRYVHVCFTEDDVLAVLGLKPMKSEETSAIARECLGVEP